MNICKNPARSRLARPKNARPFIQTRTGLGYYPVVINGASLSRGVYYCRFTSGELSKVVRMVKYR